MYTRWNNAEGQANTTVASVANSGGSATGGSGWAFDSNGIAWPTFSTDTAASGTQSYKYVYSASQGYMSWLYSKPGITGDSIWVRFAFNTSDITQNTLILNGAGNTQTILSFQTSSSKGYAGAYSTYVTGSYTLSSSTWYIVEQRCYLSSTAGYTETWISDTSGNQLDHWIAGGAANTANFATITFRFGNGSNVTLTQYLDMLAISDAGRIGALTATLPGTRYNSAEGEPSTTVATVGNTGHSSVTATSGDNFESVSASGVTFDSTYVASGVNAYECVSSSSAQTLKWNLNGSAASHTISSACYWAALPATSIYYLSIGDGAHNALMELLSSTHKWSIALNGATTVTGTYVQAAATLVRIQMTVTYGATNTTAACVIYSATGTVLDSFSTTATTAGLAYPVAANFGHITTSTGTAWIDDLAVIEGTGQLGASTPAAVPVALAMSSTGTTGPPASSGSGAFLSFFP